MNTELQMLMWSVFLGIAQLLIAAHAMTWQRGAKWNMGKRDEPVPPLTGLPGRLDRALNNFKETFPFFVAAVALLQFLNKNNDTSALGAQIYFYSRVVYVPLYAFGIIYVRSIVWFAAMVGIGMMLYTAAV